MKFELVINLKTAEALGLTIPRRGGSPPAFGAVPVRVREEESTR